MGSHSKGFADSSLSFTLINEVSRSQTMEMLEVKETHEKQ